ncbi:MAG: HEAT repeat domain-containing protein [Candidatus Thorarchaeota archaeon]
MVENKSFTLINELQESDDKIIRMKAAISLGKITENREEAIIALINTLKGESSSKVREEIVKSLGKLGKGNTKVAAILVETMMDDISESVRVYATEAMGEIGNVAVPALFSVLKNESNIEVKSKAIDALGFIGAWAKKEEPDLVQPVVAEIIRIIAEQPIEILHRQASEAILKMGQPAVKPLIQAYYTFTTSDVKKELEITLEKLAEQLHYRNRQALIRAFEND